MSSQRSRFSRRHLLALCTFLVPLAVLAVLGQSELQRQGDRIQAAISSEASLFHDSAAQALEQQIDRQMPPLLEDSRRLIGPEGAVRAAIRLRDEERHAALLDIIVIDEQAALVWPQPPAPNLGLPFARDPRGRGPETAISRGLQAADLLLTTGHLPAARRLLQHLVTKMEKADESGRGTDLLARFRLATVNQKLGHHEVARAGFEDVRNRIFPEGRGPSRTYDDVGVLADVALAEMGSDDDRVRLLEKIASHRHYSYLPGSMRTAVVERLVEGVPASHSSSAMLIGMLEEERQRAQESC